MRWKISAEEFELAARRIASLTPSWTVHRRASVLGHDTVYMKASAVKSVRASGIAVNDHEPQQQQLENAGGEEMSWCDDHDDGRAEPDAAGAESYVNVVVTYYLSRSEAYALPQLHFTVDVLEHAGASSLRLSLSRIIQEVMVGVRCAGSDDARVGWVVGTSFCEELGFVLYSLHQCDTEKALDLANEIFNGGSATPPRVSPIVQRFMWVVGPHVGFSRDLVPPREDLLPSLEGPGDS